MCALFGVAGLLSAIRKLRSFETLKFNRRSFTAFRMTVLRVEDDGAGRAFWLYGRLLGNYFVLIGSCC